MAGISSFGRESLVFGVVDQFVGGDPGHFGAQVFAHLFYRVRVGGGAEVFDFFLTALHPTFGEFTALDVF